ncbi:hypothetical protein [Chromobacterium rhizoryzae]|uniref:hypothetical protein n=1 Tax=Chromobacterium rhizoryzae TaxID=1778675 RepID=UPI001D077FFC|nr:hypothetical protein [Chromobacterium rhizoryzae]
MVTHPIHVKRSNYRGADPKKRQKAAEQNRIAAELESYINELLRNQSEPIQVYLYYQIAAKTGYPEATVRDLCFVIDGGHNGFTAIKPGLTYEQAMEQNGAR